MVKARKAAANQFDARPSTSTEPTDSVMPKARASPGAMRPAGMGRCAVRVITASMSASHHMLRQPEAPAPMAMASSEAKPSTGLMWPGAVTMPTSAVKTTSDITRGFSSAM